MCLYTGEVVLSLFIDSRICTCNYPCFRRSAPASAERLASPLLLCVVADDIPWDTRGTDVILNREHVITGFREPGCRIRTGTLGCPTRPSRGKTNNSGFPLLAWRLQTVSPTLRITPYGKRSSNTRRALRCITGPLSGCATIWAMTLSSVLRNSSPSPRRLSSYHKYARPISASASGRNWTNTSWVLPY
jgi:hypothetical protein